MLADVEIPPRVVPLKFATESILLLYQGTIEAAIEKT
jgi:hypothetical protein